MPKKGNPNFKKAPSGSSSKMKDPKPEGVKGLKKSHSSGGTVPTFNAGRIDGLKECDVPSVPK